MKHQLFVIVFVVPFLFVNTAISGSIPIRIKNNEIEFIKNNYYDSESRDFSDYAWNSEFFEDLNTFYKSVLDMNDIPKGNIPFILRGLIRIGDFKYKKDIETLSFLDKEKKLEHIAFGFYHYHKYRNSKWLKGDEIISKNYRRITMIHSGSFSSYEYPSFTPDLMLDNDISTCWRIFDISNKEEATLTLSGWVTEKNKIKILVWDGSRPDQFKKYYRPKRIRLSLYNLDESQEEAIKEKEFILEDSNKYQLLNFDLNYLDKLSKAKLISESNGYYKLRLEILSYYPGEVNHCFIAELSI